MSRIQVTIDQLALKGFDAADRKALVEGLRSELSRVLSGPAVRPDWVRSRRTPVLRLGRMPLEPGLAGGRKLGGSVARAIGKSVKP
jgi:hypothetical protein